MRPRVLTRRRLLTQTIALSSLSAVGALTLAATPGCNSDLIAADILKYIVGNSEFKRGSAVGGWITIKNESSDDADGFVDMSLLRGSTAADQARGKYSISAGYMNTYEWSGLHGDQPGDYVAQAASALTEMLSDAFSIT
jgi:hypothetical protein